MKMVSRVAAVLLAAYAAEAASVATQQSVALRWMSQHPQADQDQLAELKDANPDAYAIVKALLTKRSLGLLDPKHPTASFAGPAPQAAAPADEPVGAAAFAKFATPADEKKMASSNDLYPEVAAPPAHHDWLSWKPQQSAMDDESMVKSVLGAVAELKAGGGGNLRGAAPQPQEADPLAWTQPAPAAVDMKPAAPVAPVALAAPAAPVAPVAAVADLVPQPAAPVVVAPIADAPKAAMSQENSYLKDVDFGLKTPVEQPAAPAGENSYLKGMDFGGDLAPAAPVQTVSMAPVSAHKAALNDNHDYLASFSFDDAPTTTAAPKPAATPAPKPSNALLAWLGGAAPVKKVAPKTAAIQQPEDSMSKYLADLH